MNKKFISLLLASLFFVIGNVHASFVDFENEFTEHPEKLANWNSMMSEVDSWTDRLGLPIDQRIKETVVVLNLLGCKTQMSCEGHEDWGCPYPWIDFDVQDDEYRELFNESCHISKIMDEMGSWNELSAEEKQQYSSLNLRNREIIFRLKQIIQEKILPLYLMLEKFYNGRDVSYDRVICFTDMMSSRIQSLGGSWWTIRTQNEKKVKLLEYQREMGEFTDFLIMEYLKN